MNYFSISKLLNRLPVFSSPIVFSLPTNSCVYDSNPCAQHSYATGNLFIASYLKPHNIYSSLHLATNYQSMIPVKHQVPKVFPLSGVCLRRMLIILHNSRSVTSASVRFWTEWAATGRQGSPGCHKGVHPPHGRKSPFAY